LGNKTKQLNLIEILESRKSKDTEEGVGKQSAEHASRLISADQSAVASALHSQVARSPMNATRGKTRGVEQVKYANPD
jgi:hypothetical protein